MKLYNSTVSPNAQRVRIFLAEKGLSLDTQNLDILQGEARTPAFLEINSLGAIPVLVLDNGEAITESVAICRYLDLLHPEPPLFGTTPEEQGKVAMWIGRMELEVMRPLADVVQHSQPFFAERITQLPAYAELQKTKVHQTFRWLDEELAGRRYLAGDAFSMADIMGIAAYSVARFVDLEPAADLGNLHGWIGRLLERPSAQA